MRAHRLFYWMPALIIFAVSSLLFAGEAPAPAALQSCTPYLRGDTDGEFMYWLQRAAKDGWEGQLARAALMAFDRRTLGNPAAGQAEFAALAADPRNDELCCHYYAGDGSEAAEKFFRRRNGVSAWKIAGPFGRFERASFFEKFPPELQPFSADAKMTDGGREILWRSLPGGARPVHPWRWTDAPRGVVYLYTAVNITAETPALTLEIRSSCWWQAWFGGTLISAAPETGAAPEIRRQSRPFTDVDGPVSVVRRNFTVSPGTYPLLVKLFPHTAAGSALNNYFTAAFPGTAAENIAFDPDAPAAPAAAPAIVQEKPAAPGNDVWAALRAEAAGRTDAALTCWRRLTAAHPRMAALRTRQAAAELKAMFIPAAKRESLARAANMAALKLAPQSVPALVALGEYECGKKRYREAGEYFTRALAVNPQALPALAAAARLAIGAGWPEEAAAAIARLQAVYPRSYALALLQAQAGEKRRDFAAVYEAAARLTAIEPGEPRWYLTLAQASLLTDRSEEALTLIRQAPAGLARCPLLLNLQGQLLCARGGRTGAAAAEKIFLQAAAAGGGAETWLNTAKARLLQQDPENAAAALGQSLRWEPEQHSLRLLQKELAGTGADFWQTAAIDPDAAIKDFEKRTPPAGKTARLIDQTVLEVYPDGSYANYTHGLQAVMTDGGVREAAQVERYGEVLTARTILPERGGLSLEPVLLDNDAPLMMPAVTPGAYIENKYLQTADAPGSRILRFPQWYFRSPNSEEAFVFSQYVVRVPQGVPFTYAARNLGPNVEFKQSDDNGTKVYTWTARNMNRALHEKGGLAIDETLPFVKIGGRTSWADINRLLANFYLGKTAGSEEMRRLVQDILAPDAANLSRTEMASRIFTYVCRNVELTAWRAPASHILAQRSGDRNLALLALLQIAGLAPRLAAVRPPEAVLFAPVWEIPDLDAFTSFIVTVDDGRGKRLWLDPSSRFAQAGELPEELAGGTAFIVDPEQGGEFAVLPTADAEAYVNKEERRYSLRPGYSGVLFFQGKMLLRGAAAAELKEILAESRKIVRKQQIESVLRPGVPAVTLADYRAPDADAAGRSLTIEYTASAAGAVRERTGGLQGVPLGFAPLPLLPDEDFSNRRTPYHLQRHIAADEHFIFNFPAGTQGEKLPDDVVIRNDFGHYQLTFRMTEKGAEVRRRCHFPPQRLNMRQWKQYYQMAQTIADAEKVFIWWQK